jgi:hypothetical protein
LSPVTTYSFRVAANDAAGSSAQSAAINVTTLSGPPPPPPSGKVFAPYIDMGLTASWQLLTIQQQSGIKVFTLGFVVGNGGCTPTWGGVGATVANDTLPNGHDDALDNSGHTFSRRRCDHLVRRRVGN